MAWHTICHIPVWWRDTPFVTFKFDGVTLSSRMTSHMFTWHDVAWCVHVTTFHTDDVTTARRHVEFFSRSAHSMLMTSPHSSHSYVKISVTFVILQPISTLRNVNTIPLDDVTKFFSQSALVKCAIPSHPIPLYASRIRTIPFSFTVYIKTQPNPIWGLFWKCANSHQARVVASMSCSQHHIHFIPLTLLRTFS